MGTRIESVATAHSRRGLLGRGALHLSDEAVRACLRGANRRADELDLLVNAGLYKDRSLAEPALASIIQEDVGANPGDPPRPDHHGTFSFDVLNGGCGVLSAAQLVHLFVGTGTAELGLVVAADADPGTCRDFPFPSVGGALLLSHAAGNAGFGPFVFRAFPELADLFDARVTWEPAARGSNGAGSNVLEIRVDPSFAARCVEHAAEVATAFIESAGWKADDIDLLVASQYPRRFADELAHACGVSGERVPAVSDDLRDAHTAGPIAALEAAIASGLYQRAHRILFVTAGGGLTVAAALYTQ
jgi:3-oxoacyl-[acyl-carrier-protein] synthase-3